MVKAKKRSFRRESDDDEDSDSDYVPDLDEANPKKYSLRKRTKQTFVDDYDYDVDSDLSPPRHISEDEDFQVDGENELEPYVQYRQTPANEEGGTSQHEVDNNGLIDFEDMIRADIVINRNRIDYDSLIGSNEIKIDKRRGRPPKRKQIEEFTHSILGPLVDALVPAFSSSTSETLNSQDSAEFSTELGNIMEPVTQVTENMEKCASQTSELSEIPDGKICTKEAVVPCTNDKHHNDNGVEKHELLNSEEGIEQPGTTVCAKIQQKSKPEELKSSSKPLVNSESHDTDDVIIIEETPDVIVLDD